MAAYLHLHCGFGWDDFLGASDDLIDAALAAYGQLLFTAGRQLWSYVELINGVVDCRRDLRGRVPRAWDAAWNWKSLVPPAHRNAMPEQVFLAMLSVSIAWGMDHLTLLLGAGFLGLLRAQEIRNLRFGDFLTPSRLLSADPILLVTVRAPKMRRITAKRAYTRIDQQGFVDFADALVPWYPDGAQVFNGSYSQFRLALRALAAELGLPLDGPLALTWGSCRPGGATWLLRAFDNPELVRFRGRWASSRMLETYVQEVGAVSLLPALNDDVRTRIRTLAAAAPFLLARATLRLRGTRSTERA